MSKGFTTEWLVSRQIRIDAARHASVPQDKPEGVEREIAGLHNPIIAECKRRGWRYVHSDPYRPSTCGEGVCDFIIFADCGRVFYIECKSRSGKLSSEQVIFVSWLSRLGHKVHVIQSMREFYDILGVVPRETKDGF